MVFYGSVMMPNLIDAVNKPTTTFLIIGQNFCYTMAKILSSPTPLNKVAENTV